ncbi:hypothetical protein ACH5RR_036743 [Cinchona calisaya]|uniref:Cytochrome P450 n=1 Tax=Cinchona calisaya TaxID=153742 RepID=A0ABD2Y8L2_9GENT
MLHQKRHHFCKQATLSCQRVPKLRLQHSRRCPSRPSLETTSMTINIIMRMLAGKRYFGAETEDNDEGRRFRDIVGEMFELLHFNPVDFFPFLKWIGFQNLEKRRVLAVFA